MASIEEQVEHPKHYTSHPSGIECIEITKHHNFCVGNALKYLWRQGLKEGEPSVKDLKKARQYIEFEIERLEAKQMIDDVLDFHHALGVPVKSYPGWPGSERGRLRATLIDEEVNKELLPAIGAQDLEKIADGIADSIYVLLGTALEFGIPIEEVWRIVHKSNMSKAGGNKRTDGKILKPEGWTPPDIRGVLLDYGWDP